MTESTVMSGTASTKTHLTVVPTSAAKENLLKSNSPIGAAINPANGHPSTTA
eukprot:CAMPEP_0174936730 /NCGR_PEP_ID=MMETSP1355-20121228/58451_1 /TAXON_ID=464990 /ORGANISM="Hemiselmis tepida, Strain CCMP443" /LENGTH=51 /DNA_ID=CAMNT_0016183535 /DNA_START=43 /DNA_END=195 /DNA_ORIENTATION=+